MKQLLIALLLLLPVISFAAVHQLSDAEWDSLRASAGVTLHSTREKKGEIIEETWRGVMLNHFIASFDAGSWAQAVISSPDNYQVRIPADRAGEVMLAWACNDEPLPEPRIIWPGMREMHWVRNPRTFETRTDAPMPMPHVIYVCAGLRKLVPMRSELPPFSNATGYCLTDLARHVFPNLRGEFLMVGRDGVRHTFDWAQFLDNAVLKRSDDGLDLQCVDMPGGMWIRDLVWMQQDDTALLMLDRFTSWHDISILLGWEDRLQTAEITRIDGEKETTDIPEPGDDIWRDALLFTW